MVTRPKNEGGPPIGGPYLYLWRLERETRFELATLCLGSTLALALCLRIWRWIEESSSYLLLPGDASRSALTSTKATPLVREALAE
jgi:hypothetical protein